MRIAVASQNFRTITPHAGVTRRFLVYEAAPGEAPREVDRLDLPKELAIREFAGAGSHPLDVVDAVIVGSAGSGFVRRMAARGVATVVTSELDPLRAVTSHLDGSLSPAQSKKDDDAASASCYGAQMRLRRRSRRRTLRRGAQWRFRQCPEA